MKGVKGFQKGHPQYYYPQKGWMKRANALYCKNGHFRTSKTIVFTKSRWTSNGLLRPSDCKLCRKQRVKEHGQLQSYYTRNYGMTKAQWMDLFDSQKGACAICGKHQSELSKKLCVDHDHVSGRVRGLICTPCNLIVGNAMDDPSILQRAIVYMKSFLGGDSH